MVGQEVESPYRRRLLSRDCLSPPQRLINEVADSTGDSLITWEQVIEDNERWLVEHGMRVISDTSHGSLSCYNFIVCLMFIFVLHTTQQQWMFYNLMAWTKKL